MESILTFIIVICGIIYFVVFFIWFLSSKNPFYKFCDWVEKEIKRLTNKK